jgi:hypothetical protein
MGQPAITTAAASRMATTMAQPGSDLFIVPDQHPSSRVPLTGDRNPIFNSDSQAVAESSH